MNGLEKAFLSILAGVVSAGCGQVAYDVYGLDGLLRMAGVELPVKIQKQKIEVVKEVEKPDVNFDEALQKRMAVSRVSKTLVDCVLNRESSGNKRMSLTRFEQSYIDRGLVQRITSNKDEQRLWASSWCPFQVMGTWARKFQLDWSDLLQPETCVHVGMTILEDCWKESQGHGRQKIYNTGLCYNGPTGRDYASALVECVSSKAIDQMMEG